MLKSNFTGDTGNQAIMIGGTPKLNCIICDVENVKANTQSWGVYEVLIYTFISYRYI